MSVSAPERPAAPTAPPLTPRRPRFTVLVALLVAVTLLVTTVVLAVQLPDAVVAAHWSLAWAGFDVATGAAALATAFLLHRGDRRAALPAAAGSALLALDAWMGVTTAAAGAARTLAIVEAAALEVPLAIAALLLAVRLLTPARPGRVSYPPPTRTTSGLHP